jgi:hypothetical protein
MFEEPPTFAELMVWAETGVPPELQNQGATRPNNSIVVTSLENKTLSETSKDNTTLSPRDRMNRTWLQGALAAGVVGALEVVIALSWSDGLDWKFIAFALVQAFVTGLVAYYHKSKSDVDV